MHPEKKAFLDSLNEYFCDKATHNAFSDWLEENDEPELADLHRQWSLKKHSQAEEWLRIYASEFEMLYEELLRAANHYLDTGEKYTLYFQTPDIIYDNRSTFWGMFQTVTCRIVSEDNRIDFIRCAC